MTSRIPVVTPEIVEISQDELRKLDSESECHTVPFGEIKVEAFDPNTEDGAILREAVARFFGPDYADPRLKFKDGPVDRDMTKLYQLLYNVFPDGLIRDYHSDDRNFSNLLVCLRIIITYPLNETWQAHVEIPPSQIGAVFAIVHDMYAHVYALDNAEWQKQGHQDRAPRVSEKQMNRARGTHVFGHDMSDLVFEYLAFTPDPKWPKVTKKKFRILDVNEPEPEEDELEEVLEPLDVEKHDATVPFIGTFSFYIGS